MPDSTKPLPRQPRVSLNIPAYLVCADGELLEVTVLDLSGEGFRVKVPEPLFVNERVQLEMGRAGYAAAIIRWVSGGEAGGAFTSIL